MGGLNLGRHWQLTAATGKLASPLAQRTVGPPQPPTWTSSLKDAGACTVRSGASSLYKARLLPLCAVRVSAIIFNKGPQVTTGSDTSVSGRVSITACSMCEHSPEWDHRSRRFGCNIRLDCPSPAHVGCAHLAAASCPSAASLSSGIVRTRRTGGYGVRRVARYVAVTRKAARYRSGSEVERRTAAHHRFHRLAESMRSVLPSL